MGEKKREEKKKRGKKKRGKKEGRESEGEKLTLLQIWPGYMFLKNLSLASNFTKMDTSHIGSLGFVS